ncbi:unnamed protein product [Polarella glacialis]|uniref:Feruloyl esterase n=1 Tax=Polarella glacialis TaxID=89957 RepID=A0A813E549_POLGL|nr:unnamed protein product [Polarella glacialis]CAE8679404.1 unnamed protein product [Polarella glacialis]
MVLLILVCCVICVSADTSTLWGPLPDKVPDDQQQQQHLRQLQSVAAHFTSHTIESGGTTREFKVYIPSGMRQAATPPAGLVMFFHGYTSSVESTCGSGGPYFFNPVQNADDHNFIAVCPQGLGGSKSGWNCEGCCGAPAMSGVDDVRFVSEMMDNLRDVTLPGLGVSYPTKNVLAIGHSTGGLFAYRLGCELSGRIDGVAPVGAAWDYVFGYPNPMTWPARCAGKGVSVWNAMGTIDYFTTATTAKAKWRTYSENVLACSPESVQVTRPSSTVECTRYSSCAGIMRSQLCIYDGMGHVVTQMDSVHNVESTKSAWNFLTNSSSLLPALLPTPVPSSTTTPLPTLMPSTTRSATQFASSVSQVDAKGICFFLLGLAMLV